MDPPGTFGPWKSVDYCPPNGYFRQKHRECAGPGPCIDEDGNTEWLQVCHIQDRYIS